LCRHGKKQSGDHTAISHWSLELLARQASTLLSDGRVFTIGGSWNGGIFIKNGEIWSQNGNWTLLPGCPVRCFHIQHLTAGAASATRPLSVVSTP